MGLGGIHELLHLFGALAQGLLAQNIEAVVQQVKRHREVLIGVGGVGNKVDVGAVEQLTVIGVGIAAKILSGSFCTGGVVLNNRDNVADIVVLGAQECAVDVTAAASMMAMFSFFMVFSFCSGGIPVLLYVSL